MKKGLKKQNSFGDMRAASSGAAVMSARRNNSVNKLDTAKILLAAGLGIVLLMGGEMLMTGLLIIGFLSFLAFVGCLIAQ